MLFINRMFSNQTLRELRPRYRNGLAIGTIGPIVNNASGFFPLLIHRLSTGFGVAWRPPHRWAGRDRRDLCYSFCPV